MKTQAVVVGAGPAGTSAALGLLKAGIAVTVLEARADPVSAVCGGYLSHTALPHLDWLNIPPPDQWPGAARVTSVQMTGPRGGRHTVKVHPFDHVVSRGWLERALLDQVISAGGHVRTGTRMAGYTRTDRGWLVSMAGTREALCADILVLSDGWASGRRAVVGRRGWHGWRASFLNVRQDPGEVSIHFHPGGLTGVLTRADGRSTVCGLHWVSRGPVDWESVFLTAREHSPAFDALLTGSRREDPWRGTGPLVFTPRLRRSDGPLRAGDSAATGHPLWERGLARALASGPLIEAALENANETTPLPSAWRAVLKSYNPSSLWTGWLWQAVVRQPLAGHLLSAVLVRPRLARFFLPS